MDIEKLKQLAEEARAVEQAIRPLAPHMGLEPGFVDGETWVAANGIADDLNQAYLDALSDEALGRR